MLSSAGYGPVTITQAVSIINTSNFAGVTVGSGGTGITINAGAGDSIVLRGLTIDGGGTGSIGIELNSGLTLTVDQCNVLNFVGGYPAGNGILIHPTSAGHNIIITNTSASNNQSAGVQFQLSGTALTAIVIDRVNANNNTYGIAINNGSSSAATASISNSMGSLNTVSGFLFANVIASLDASNATSNGQDGVLTLPGATLALGRSVLVNNAQYGLNIAAGNVNSYKDNRIAGNVAGQVFGPTGVATLY